MRRKQKRREETRVDHERRTRQVRLLSVPSPVDYLCGGELLLLDGCRNHLTPHVARVNWYNNSSESTYLSAALVGHTSQKIATLSSEQVAAKERRRVKASSRSSGQSQGRLDTNSTEQKTFWEGLSGTGDNCEGSPVVPAVSQKY